MQVMHIAAVTELQERLLPSLEHLHVRRLHLHLLSDKDRSVETVASAVRSG